MILYFKKIDSHAVLLMKGFEEDKTASKPGKAQKVQPNIVKRKYKSDKQYDHW